ncbi:fimbrial protein [Burkholderia cepacia]|uniref:fimbrial protein n=1 Tax=Burkholderia cepacia TaxID=292 RepID=UPI0021BBD329|nr:fimbrial protein [Burkholderia cepacia]
MTIAGSLMKRPGGFRRRNNGRFVRECHERGIDMTTTKNDVMRAVRTLAQRTLLLLAGVAAGAVAPTAWGANVEVTAFGQQLSIPKLTPSGTILARHYITPLQACGKTKCTIYSRIVNYPNGGVNGPGPIITTNVSGVSTRLLINGQAYETNFNLSSPIEFSQPLEVQLLADGRANTGGSLAGTNGATPFYFSMMLKEIAPYFVIALKGTITPIDGTCSTPAQNVTLPGALLRKFGDVGSTVGAHSFQIRINNCPKGYNRIGYTMEPRGGVIANAPGVLPAGADSTASGVKIRVTDDKGVPATFGTSIKVGDYDKATGGSYAIPMLASYIKTDATVTLGTVSGAMTVLLDYQ